MRQRSQRYVRRRRGWLGQSSDSDDASSVSAEHVPLAFAASGPPRRRRGRPHFDERMAATRALVAYSVEDEAHVEATSGLLHPHIAAVAQQIFRELLSHPETSEPYRDTAGEIDLAYVAVRQRELEEWLGAVVGEPLDGATAEFVASVGLAYVRRERPGARVKARQVLATVSRVQSLFVAILTDAVPRPKELGACVDAWCKHLMIHLDILLSVYGSTESSANWY